MEQEHLPSFNEIVSILPGQSRDFLALRLLGLNVKQACKSINIAVSTGNKYTNTPGFKEAEQFVISRRSHYLPEARVYLLSSLQPQAISVLSILLNKGLDWDNVSATDKPFIMKAVEYALHLSVVEGSRKSDTTSYEELVITARRSINGLQRGGGTDAINPERQEDTQEYETALRQGERQENILCLSEQGNSQGSTLKEESNGKTG